MTNNKRVLKVASSWISIVYVICFGGVALVPGIRSWFMGYALHTEVDIGTNVMTLTTFITGLVIWNVIAILAVWLYVTLTNYFNK
ncbi:MAG: hypothetical protein A3G46_01795 [Candidatus Zambryskibacteria bacterium RIFCSPLOWO2_12_FULL_39_16]|uniref:Uncharacterized protein n=1 Tax=Candidatus Zambryskibacteria bacterium RIFCSPLOWO2_12_FULL_39_16 TaxID=1802775 RepID=A0A1G2UU90_9BACT|nr:MAG: hypothetical protein A3I19_02625 [Candidatus Zambryskibacteria bacterium RIFCSPLOWO2_02_FULL_38_13]OHB12946.1 MAG: hypothetical protein A3G46_01795 [Candidatus Zambryskibacteria bacterium RIFCSPLOWO2_12_FULL_39_16]